MNEFVDFEENEQKMKNTNWAKLICLLKKELTRKASLSDEKVSSW